MSIKNILNPHRYPQPFIFELTMNATDTIVLPLDSGYNYGFRVNYGDGSGWLEVQTWNDVNATHLYVDAGTYEVRIEGTCESFWVENDAYRLKYTDIKNWGDIGIVRMNFYGCSNLPSVLYATDVPNLSSCTNINSLFRSCGTISVPNINNWNTSNITSMNASFFSMSFNDDIGNWDVSNVTDMTGLFRSNPIFNQNINGWNTGNVLTFTQMFYQASAYNQPMNSWNVSSATSMSQMFRETNNFNQDLNNWNTSSVQDFSTMFRDALVFNGNVSTWNTSSANNMSQMFYITGAFNQNLNTSGSIWDVSGVTDFSNMFRQASVFNGTLTGWTTTAATNMNNMFRQATNFNQDVSGFDLNGVTRVDEMFRDADAFNQDISGWTMTTVQQYQNMFRDNGAFDQDLGGWNVVAATDMTDFGTGANFSTANYDSILTGWDALSLPSSITFGINAKYTACEVEYGTTDSTTANKLVDSTQTAFLTTISIDDVVYNETDDTYATVTAIDSNTTLSLSHDIMVSGEAYSIQTHPVAKAKERMVNDDSWTMVDGGFVGEDWSTYDADYRNVLIYACQNGLGIPTAANQANQNQLMLDLKTSGVYSKMDVLYVLSHVGGGADYGWINWADPDNFSLTNSWNAFTNGDGYAPRNSGSTSEMNSGYTPSVDGVNYTQNDCSRGFYAGIQGSSPWAGSDFLMIADAVGSDLWDVAATIRRSKINSTSETQWGTGVILFSAANTFHVINRTASNAVELFQNGSSAKTDTTASTGLPDVDIILGRRNSLFTNRFKIIFWGASLTATEVANFDTNINDYFDTI